MFLEITYITGMYTGSRQLVTDLLRGNWRNGFWPWCSFVNRIS